MLDKLGHPVQGKSGLEITEIADLCVEGLPLDGEAAAR
jgi:hypothetical protein